MLSEARANLNFILYYGEFKSVSDNKLKNLF